MSRRSKPSKSAAEPERVVSTGFHERVYDVVRQIPRGQVATYGQVAEILGHPGVARHVGNALAACEHARVSVPWQRVVNARGMISTSGGTQRTLLEREGVSFTSQGAVSLSEHRWQGPVKKRSARRASTRGTR